MQPDAVLDGAFDAVVTIDGAGAIIGMNIAAERMFGYPRHDAIGHPFGHLLLPEDARDAIVQRGVGHRLETYALRRNGERFPIELSLSQLDTSNGLLYTAWIRDLSDRRAAEEALRQSEVQLRQAQKMEAVGRLAGGVAHDFNNVLTAIFGYADLLLDGFDAEDPRRADVEEIKRAANRAAALTRQLLAFSRKQVMQPKRVNLNEIIANIQTLLAKLVGDDIQLRVFPDPSLGDVRADPGQIEQVLMNLAANSRDAMPEGGTLTITTANADLQEDDATALVGIEIGQFVTLTVADSGHGIPPHVRPHVLEPVFTPKEQGEGTGLGLATGDGIGKQSGGWIYLEETPGPGASFKVYLPRMNES